ncbi:hypothetical protein Hypma_004557, partial [Hypsizygus marmoreus]
TRMM